MMNYSRKCCISNCSWELARNLMIYYPFPPSDKMKQKWFTALNMSDDNSTLNSYICAGHFEANELATIDENTTVNESNVIKQESELLDSNIISLNSEPLLTANIIKNEINSDTEIENYFGSYEILDPSIMVNNKNEIAVPKLIRLEDSTLISKSIDNHVGWWTKSSENHSKYIMNMETPDERRRRMTRERVQRWRAKKALERLTNLTHQKYQNKSNCKTNINSLEKNMIIISASNLAKNQPTHITNLETREKKQKRLTREREQRCHNSFKKSNFLTEKSRHSDILMEDEVKRTEEHSASISDAVKQKSKLKVQTSSSMTILDDDCIKVEIDDDIEDQDYFGNNIQTVDLPTTVDEENNQNWIKLKDYFQQTHANGTEAKLSEHHSKSTKKTETPEERKRRMTRERVQRWRAKKSFERLAGLRSQKTYTNNTHQADIYSQHNDDTVVITASRSLKDQTTLFNSIMETREDRKKRLTRERVQRWRAKQLAKTHQNPNSLSKSIHITQKHGLKQKYKLFDRNFLTLNKKLHIDVSHVKNEISPDIEIEDYFEPYEIVDPLATSDDKITMPLPKLIKLEDSSENITYKRMSTRSGIANSLAETTVKTSEYHFKNTKKIESSEDRNRLNRERVRCWSAKKSHLEFFEHQNILSISNDSEDTLHNQCILQYNSNRSGSRDVTPIL